MKKILTTLLILGGIYSIASAQQKNDVQFGFNVGYNASTSMDNQAGFTNTSSYSYLSGFNAAFSAEYYFSDRWSIKGKLIYDQKGWGNGYVVTQLTTPDGQISNTLAGDIRSNYLTVPIMANWHFGRRRNWYLHFGPYVGFLMNAKLNPYGGQGYDGGSVDVKNDLNSTDFGLALGIGIKFPISDKVKLFIEDDGQAGIANLIKQTDGSRNIQSERSSINIGFVFAVK
jgi:opacity protein-like surface antigen